ncbi:lipopolysaccharide biosynthesis protein [Streptomyces phyllanthi]|uniref:Lipopolysaccharide biosynthesis protein n=2 Tax=Streptomyces phyllanthi TaxID=1803180 RepID=A0A5N8WHH0_9ACTN|nr:lipopolysaccharide biosynthesis protein [Streptomyces phyllanthi]MPY45934.1 lipopolysaccharide biosynthesis protein [Streptomyces phyllanthi]
MTSKAESPTPPIRSRPALRRLRALPPWSALAAAVVTGCLAGGAYGAFTPPAYSATAYVIAVPTKKADPQAALGFAQAYSRVATQLAVLGDAQVWAGVPMRTLRRSVRSATSPDAPMVAVTATSAQADLAVDMANAVSRSLTRHANHAKNATHVELLRFSRAVRPTEPSSASPALTGLVGASAGGLLGGLAMLVRPRRAAADGAPSAAVPGPATAADARGQR